jgi:hypothetical protein
LQCLLHQYVPCYFKIQSLFYSMSLLVWDWLMLSEGLPKVLDVTVKLIKV